MNKPHLSLLLTMVRAHLTRRPLQNMLAIGGVAIGMMVLITALSLTNGFTNALIESTLRASPHLILSSPVPLPPSPELEAELRARPEVAALTPYVADKGLLTRGRQGKEAAGVDFATLFGVSSEGAAVLGLSPAESQLLRDLKDNEIILGGTLARSLGAFPGNDIELFNAKMRRTPLHVVGFFQTGNYLIDSGYAFTNVATLQKISSHPQDITGYHVRLNDPDKAPILGKEITAHTHYSALSWQQMYGSLLQQMSLQKKVIGFVVFLIVMVALFGIANVLTLVVFEKSAEIAIMGAMGASRTLITQLFILEGFFLGLGGLIIGNILGLALSYYFVLYPFKIPGDLYFITSLPVEIRLSDLLWVNALALLTTLLSGLIPARRAAGLEPARLIR